jgi:CheY-like chemotaxis protein
VPKPDLVLLNLNMPRVTGFDVLQAIANDAQHTCGCLSSSSMDSDKAKCLALGARGFITKPTDLNDFLKVLRNVCDLIA